jgi:hypothetical protein
MKQPLLTTVRRLVPALACTHARFWTASAVALLLIALPSHALAQCGVSVPGHFGGETTAVAQLNATTLITVHGTEVELLSLANPAAPVSFSPRRTMGLAGPAVKVAMTQGSSKAFVLLQTGQVQVISLFGATIINNGVPPIIPRSNCVDIVADGTRVYIARQFENIWTDDMDSEIYFYETSSGTPQLLTWMNPLADTYGYDRLAMVGNILWAGFHELNSTIFGVEGFNVSNPANPVRTGAALNNTPIGINARVSAMTAVGTKLLVSVRNELHGDQWLRAVNVAVPTNPTWQPPADLNAVAGCMSSTGNTLRITYPNLGVGTWDTTNMASLTWLGNYNDSFPTISQMLSVPATDYWAAGPAGLMTMNTTNPAAMSVRSPSNVPLPTAPKVVRQRGNITVVLDYTLNALRFFDYTLPEGQQLRSSFALPWYSELLELGELAGPVALACVASKNNPAGDVIAIIDFTNPAAPFTRTTISGFRPHLLSVSGSRLYAFTTGSEFRIYELSQLPALLRSTSLFADPYTTFTCMTSWSNNAAAIGTAASGIRLLNTTNATAPVVAATWMPATGYRVHSMAKSPLYLYVSASNEVAPNNRLEVLSVTNIAAPSQRFAVTSTVGFGNPGTFSSLTYISNAVGKFLVGMRGTTESQSNVAIIFNMLNFFSPESIPCPIAYQLLPLGHGNVAPNADGSRFMVAADGAGLYQVAVPTTWAPAFGLRTGDQRLCVRAASASISMLPSANPTAVTYQWYRNGVALTNGPTPWGSTISGATDWSLVIDLPRTADARYITTGGFEYSYATYSCIATNSCGSTTSPTSYLTICGADLANTSGAGFCDGAVDINDLLYFLTQFELGAPAADLDDGTGTGNYNGAVDVNDLLYFLIHFERGC